MFHWYKHKSGIIDYQQLFYDAFYVLKHGIPKMFKLPYMTIREAVMSRGLLNILHDIVDTAAKYNILPSNVIPIFDLQKIPVQTQQHAFEIYKMTGRFSNNIIGYFNVATTNKIFIHNMCPKKKRGGALNLKVIYKEILTKYKWITLPVRKQFSPKELCLLISSIFAYGDDINIMLDKTSIQTCINIDDDTNVICMSDLYTHCEKYISEAENIESIIYNYLCKVIDDQGPFVVLNSDNTINQECTNHVLVGQTQTIRSHLLNRANRIIELPNGLHGFNLYMKQCIRCTKLFPRVPCETIINDTGEQAKLIVFNFEKDKWYIWNGINIGEYRRCDFQILENVRSLPAPIKTLTQCFSNARLNLFSLFIFFSCYKPRALRSSGEENGYWIDLGNNHNVKMFLGKDFVWKDDFFYDPSVITQQEHASQRTPEQLDIEYMPSAKKLNNEEKHVCFPK